MSEDNLDILAELLRHAGYESSTDPTHRKYWDTRFAKLPEYQKKALMDAIRITSPIILKEGFDIYAIDIESGEFHVQQFALVFEGYDREPNWLKEASLDSGVRVVFQNNCNSVVTLVLMASRGNFKDFVWAVKAAGCHIIFQGSSNQKSMTVR